MNLKRHDSLITRLGDRNTRNLWRVWIEDNGFERLRRNNFRPGTAFTARRRAGVGLVISETAAASCHVSSRRSAALLSYEASDLGSFFASSEIRVRISVGHIVVSPLLRFHAVARPASECWRIEGNTVTTPAGVLALRTPEPLTLRQTAACIAAKLDEQNLVFATELIGNQRAGRVLLQGAPLLLTICDQFLRAAGYGTTDTPGEYLR